MKTITKATVRADAILTLRGYSMVLTMPVPNGTRLTIWQGAEDRA